MIDPRWAERWRWPVATGLITVAFGIPLVAGGAHAAVAGAGLGLTLAGRTVRRVREPSTLAMSGWRFANAAFLVACMIAAAARAPLLLVGLALVVWLQVHRGWTGRSADDDRVAVLLSLLLLLLGAILTERALLAPLLLLYVLLTPVALVLCQLGRGRTRALPGAPGRRGGLGVLLLLGPAGFALSGLLFVAIPRLQGGQLAQLSEAESVAGFGDEVALGDIGEIKDNPAIVMRARIYRPDGGPVAPPFYMRGAGLDRFDGIAWTRSDWGGGGNRDRSTSGEGPEVYQEILLEPLEQPVLFGMPVMTRIEDLEDRAWVDGSGTWRAERSGRRVSYTAVSVLWPREVHGPRSRRLDLRSSHSPVERAALRSGLWLGLPEDLDPRIHQLARSLQEQAGPRASPYARAAYVEGWLQDSYTYTLVPDPVDQRQPLAGFLFDSRRGHCEYFATALAVLLRAQGLPARVVNGFYGGEWNELGSYWIFRQRDAHSWVEVWTGEGGWISLDATPAGASLAPAPGVWTQATDWAAERWHRSFLRYDLDTQIGLGLRAARFVRTSSGSSRALGLPSWSPLVLFLGLGLAGLWSLRRLLILWAGVGPRRRGRPQGGVDRLHHRARRLVRRRGWEIPEGLPPVEAARWLRERVGPQADGLEELAWLRYRVRYGGEGDDRLRPAARAAWQRLQELPRRRRA